MLVPVLIMTNTEETYIKKRLGGSGGYRIYFLVHINKSNVYLMFVHPKPVLKRSENITDEHKAMLYKNILSAIESNNLFEVTLTSEKDNLFYKATTLKL